MSSIHHPTKKLKQNESEISLLREYRHSRSSESSNGTQPDSQSQDTLLSSSSSEFSARTGSSAYTTAQYYPSSRSANILNQDIPEDHSSTHSSTVPKRLGSTVHSSTNSITQPKRLRSESGSSQNTYEENPYMNSRSASRPSTTSASSETSTSPTTPFDRPLLPERQPPRQRKFCCFKGSPEPSSEGRSSSHTCCLRRRFLLIITIIALMFSFSTCVYQGYILLKKITPMLETHSYKTGDYEVCIPCKSLETDDMNKENKQRVVALIEQLLKQGDECCARNAGEMSALIEAIASQPKPDPVLPHEKEDLEKFRFSPVSAHKFLIPFDKNEKRDSGKCSDESHHLKLSLVNDGWKEHSRNVTSRNNSLGIIHSGWYFVYSSIYFKSSLSKNCHQPGTPQEWGHYILRYGPNRPADSGILTKTVYTCETADDHHTSYTAGVFKLQEHDQIYVQVSGKGMVSYEEQSSYLGLVMMGSVDSGEAGGEGGRTRRGVDFNHMAMLSKLSERTGL